MLAPLLALVAATLTEPCRHQGLLVSSYMNSAMLDPERERWAVGRLVRLGEDERRETALPHSSGESASFPMDLDVTDGWNVPRGALRVSWWPDEMGERRETLTEMVGSTVLVRLAPVKDGEFQLVSGTDAEPYLTPVFFARSGESFASTVMPYPEGARIEAGPPVWRRWATLWRAATVLHPDAYTDFLQYLNSLPPPVTLVEELQTVPSADGSRLIVGVPGGRDVAWLLDLARRTNPEFELLAASALDFHRILGIPALQRDLIRRSLREPALFPRGVFQVTGSRPLDSDLTNREQPWLSGSAVVDALVGPRSVGVSPTLARDLLALLHSDAPASPSDRARLLPLLRKGDERMRAMVRRFFDREQGKPPEGADPIAWHTARARMTRAELAAAKKAG